MCIRDSIVGGFFLGAHDEARISVVPLTPPVGAAREATVAALGAEPGLQGAALRIQF